MHTIRWMPFGSTTWHAVLCANERTISKLLEMLALDDEIEKLQLISPSTKIILTQEWELKGQIKWTKT